MKKLAVIMILVFINFSAYSQCEKIKPVFDEMKDETIIASPYKSNFSGLTGMPKNNYELSFKRITNKEGQYNLVTFIGYGATSLIGAKGLYVKFSNNEIKRFEDLSISSKYLTKGIYYYVVTLILDEEMLSLVQEHSITNFDISLYKYQVKEKDAKMNKEYANCVFK